MSQVVGLYKLARGCEHSSTPLEVWRAQSDRVHLSEVLNNYSLSAKNDRLKIDIIKLQHRAVPRSLVIKLAADNARVLKDQTALRTKGWEPIAPEDCLDVMIASLKESSKATAAHNSKFPDCQIADSQDLLDSMIRRRADLARIQPEAGIKLLK